jgi:sialate O-acetylesterase
MRSTPLRALALLLTTLAATATADVKLPAIFGDHMVLQRDQKVSFWGTADPGETVTVTVGSAKGAAAAGQDGKWSLKLDGVKTSDEPVEVTVAGKNTITLKDVLIGDVWVASGQSNMAWGLKGTHNAKADIAKADRPKIRLFTVAHKVAFQPQENCGGKWQVCTPATAPDFSAVAYYFGVDIQASQKVPVGLINTSWGGTPAQAWTSIEALAANPATKGMADGFVKLRDNLPEHMEKYKQAVADWEVANKKWQEEVNQPYQEAVKKWKDAGSKPEDKPALAKPAPKKPSAPDASPNHPSVLFNGMIAPIIPLSIRGAIWYQGESNAGQNVQYRELFPAMITDWRTRWGQGDFPFLWVQLANYLAREDNPQDHSGRWPGLREAQSMTLKLPNTGQAVIIDIGEGSDIHPRNKADVGRRLALAARHVAYGEKLIHSGPVFKSMQVEGDKIRLSFEHVGGGLTIGVAPPIRIDQEPARPAEKLTGFAIAGADKKFVWADAVIDGDTVVVSSPQIKEPAMVHYAWNNNPECNLYNKEGLPASPFRTETDAPKAAAK